MAATTYISYLLLAVIATWTAINLGISDTSVAPDPTDGVPASFSYTELSMLATTTSFYPAVLHAALCVIILHAVSKNHYTTLVAAATACLVFWISDLIAAAFFLNQTLNDDSKYLCLRRALCADDMAPSGSGQLCKRIKAAGVLGVIWLIGEFVLFIATALAARAASATKPYAGPGDTKSKASFYISLLSGLGLIITFVSFFEMNEGAEVKVDPEFQLPPVKIGAFMQSWNHQFDQSYHLLALSMALTMAYWVSPGANPVLKQQLISIVATFCGLSFWGYFVFNAYLSQQHPGRVDVDAEGRVAPQGFFYCSDQLPSGYCHAAKAYVAGNGIIAITQTLIGLLTISSLATEAVYTTASAEGRTGNQQPLMSAASDA